MKAETDSYISIILHFIGFLRKMTIFVTSDSHFNHINICGPKISKWKKGFRNFDTLKEMEDLLVENCNSLVKEDDILYHLGDFIMGKNVVTELPRIRNRIICKTIHHIPGNHAQQIRKNKELQKNFASISERYSFYYKNHFIVMDHYPIVSWEDMAHGALHCYGHCHGNYIAPGRAMDVGVDCNSFKPFLLDDIVDILLAKPIVEVDHHKVGEQ